MDDDLKKIKKMTLFMRKQGLLRLKTSQIELELSPSALSHDFSHGLEMAPVESEREIPANPSADEIALGLAPGMGKTLFWSAPGQLPAEDA